MKRFFVLLLFFVSAERLVAQNADLFYKKGDSLSRARDYNNAASVYASAIKTEGSKARVDRFITVARQWCLANSPDSAYFWLNQLATSPYIAAIDVRTIENNKEFKLLETDKRWNPLLNSLKKRAASNYQIEELVYGRKEGVALTLLHLKPKTKSNGKAIIRVVAGSWFSSYLQAEYLIRPSAMYLEKGFTVFLVIVGSQPRFPIPSQIEDVKRSVRYIRYNASKFGIDPNRIGIEGSSAGGHLSLVVATANDRIDSTAFDVVDRVSSRVQAAAVLFPPTDLLNWGTAGFTAINNKSLLLAYKVYGAVDFKKMNEATMELEQITDTAQRTKIAREISPIYHVTTDDPPVMIIHGTADLTVPLQQSELFISKLKEAGITNNLIVKKGVGHNYNDMMPELYQFVDWFEKHLK